jgi:hypothetical protein
MKYTFISDEFCEDGFSGGGETCNKELINCLLKKGHSVEKIYSFFCSPDCISNSNSDIFIIGNFLKIPPETAESLKDKKYIIYEHDHKFLMSRNPSVYENFIAPKNEIVNYNFYKNSYKIVAQSSTHKKIIELNLGLNNVEYCVNLWSEEDLINLESFQNIDKKYDACFMNHIYEQKNAKGAKDFCLKNNYNYISINHNTEHKKFCEILASSRNFVFFPKVFETLSRVCIEANCLNTDIIGNQNIAYLLESWSSLRGLELINFLRESKNKTVEIFEN